MVLAKFLYNTKSLRNFALLFQHNARFFCLAITDYYDQTDYAGIMWITPFPSMLVSLTEKKKHLSKFFFSKDGQPDICRTLPLLRATHL